MKQFVIGLLLVCCVGANQATAQTIYLKGKVGLRVDAPAKEIVAESDKFTLDIHQDGKFKFSVPVRSFEFSNNFATQPLNEKLKSRFNDFYMESSRYPVIEFTGKIPDFLPGKNGNYTREGKGFLTTHGVTREVAYTCHISIRNKQVSVQATTEFVPVYFNIPIPSFVSDFYFKKIKIELSATNSH